MEDWKEGMCVLKFLSDCLVGGLERVLREVDREVKESGK